MNVTRSYYNKLCNLSLSNLSCFFSLGSEIYEDKADSHKQQKLLTLAYDKPRDIS